MLKVFLTFVAPVLLGLHLAEATPSALPSFDSLGISREEMMRFSRRMELLHVQIRHEALSLEQKSNLISVNIAQGLHQLENLSLDNTVGRRFEVASNAARPSL